MGKHASKQERSEAMRNGQGFVLKKNYSNKTSVARVIDGGEPAEFRSLFNNWKVFEESTGFGKQNTGNTQSMIAAAPIDWIIFQNGM